MRPSTELTIKQAAAALGVSSRTIRRRIAEGELSASKVLRGKLEVTILDASEVARWAQSHDTEWQTPLTVTGAPPAEPGKAGPTVAEVVATCDGQRETIAAQAVTIASLRAEVEFLREQVRLLTTRALPPANVERPGWWQRLTGRGATNDT